MVSQGHGGGPIAKKVAGYQFQAVQVAMGETLRATELALAHRGGTHAGFLKPDLRAAERTVAQVEGWILGVPALIRTARKGEDTAISPVRTARRSSPPSRPVSVSAALSEDDRHGANKALKLLCFRLHFDAGRACMRSLERETGDAERHTSTAI